MDVPGQVGSPPCACGSHSNARPSRNQERAALHAAMGLSANHFEERIVHQRREAERQARARLIRRPARVTTRLFSTDGSTLPCSRGGSNAILVASSLIPGLPRRDDDVIAVDWDRWVPPEIVGGLCAEL